MTIRVLIVEDDMRLRHALTQAVENEGHRAEGVGDAEEALRKLKGGGFDFLVTDVGLPGMSGLDLLGELGRLEAEVIPIVMTAYGTIDIAVDAMKRGAADFFTKPFQAADLTGLIRSLAGRKAGRTTRKSVAAAAQVLAASPVMLRLLEQVEQVARFNTTVLVTGETGTGKEMIARAIHLKSPRAANPLVALNCAAIPEHLLEDELFGHVKGAFTGAQGAREGRFEQADGGTLFLDEIGDMSPPLQSKLLRVLQEKEFDKLGSNKTVRVDVRVIAATSADLKKKMETGEFRPDLFYRLNVVNLRIPPLRERPEDVRPLGEFFLRRFCESAGLPEKRVEEAVWARLEKYDWPGNVRQLQNSMERAAALSGLREEINEGDLPEEVRAPDRDPEEEAGRVSSLAGGGVQIPEGGLDLEKEMALLEVEAYRKALQKSGGNKSQAAKLIGRPRTTFLERLKQLARDTGIDLNAEFDDS